ncbi:MAG: hypothetical protein ACRBCT_03315 [Alphaproteobacteria bacterium]
MPHDHGHHKDGKHHHHHHHPHEEQKPSDKKELRLTVLAASLFGERARTWVAEHNTGFLFSASAALASADIVANAVIGHSTLAQIDGFGEAIGVGGMTLSLMGMNDSTENLMEQAEELEKSKGVPRFITASMSAMSHQIPEAAVTGISLLAGQSAQNVASLAVGKITHAGMLWGAAAVGTMNAISSEHWKIHAKGMGGLSAAFAAPIFLSDYMPMEATVATGAVMALKIAPWYGKKLGEIGHECIVHGPSCNGHHHDHDHGHHHKHDHAHHHSEEKPPPLLQRVNEYRKDPAAQKAALSTVTLGLSSVVMHDSVNILSEAFALSTTSTGFLRGITLSASEAMFTIKAALKKDDAMLWGSIAGCMAASGFLEGITLVSNPEMPSLLKAWPQMTAYTLATAGSLAMVHPKSVKAIGQAKNNLADWGERNFGGKVRGVSNWLRNDTKTLAKEIAIPATIALVGYLGYASTLPDLCHSHGVQTHCGVDGIDQGVLLEKYENLPGIALPDVKLQRAPSPVQN